jgi:hypothetical protein
MHQLPITQALTCIIENNSYPLHHPVTLVFLDATIWKLQLPMFKHPLETLRTPILHRTSLPPLIINIFFLQLFHSDTSFIYGFPVTSLFCYTALLCLHQCLSPRVYCTFFSSLRYEFLFLAYFALLLFHDACFYPHESLSIVALISSLFCIFILSVPLLHASCVIPLHVLHNITVLHFNLFTATLPSSCLAP